MQNLFVIVHPDRRYTNQLDCRRQIERYLTWRLDWPVWWEVSTPDPDWQWILRTRANPQYVSYQTKWGTLNPPIRAWCMGWHTNYCVIDWIRDCMPDQGESWIVASATVALDRAGRPCTVHEPDYENRSQVQALLRDPIN